jgi:glycerate kinase
MPISDGGEGMLSVVAHQQEGNFHSLCVTGPNSSDINAQIYEAADCCFVEGAEACGLEKTPVLQRNPLLTTSFGVGQLILKALDLGSATIVLALGGSATVDGGAGMLAALGACFFDCDERQFIPSGGTLSDIARADFTQLDLRLAQRKLVLAADVNNPLCGQLGAAKVFGPQKGALPEGVDILQRGLLHWSDLLVGAGGIDIRHQAGAGAAGGLASGLMALLNVKMQPGIDVVLDRIHFDEGLQGADLVITGEGRVDGQTQFGKAPIGVARRADGIPVVLLCAELAEGYESVYPCGVQAVFSATPKVIDLHQAIDEAPKHLADLAENVARLFLLNR